jgi:hypothetical protein
MTPTEGQLDWYFFAAIVLAIPASMIVVAWYRRTVHESMSRPSGATAQAPVEAVASAAFVGGSGAARDSRTRTRLAVVYTLAGLAASTVLLVLWSRANDVALTPIRIVLLGWTFSWPIVAAMATLLALPRRWAWLLPALYAAVGAAIVVVWSLISLHFLGRSYVSPVGNLVAYGTLLASQALAPFAIIVVTGHRKVRGVSPLCLAALLLFGQSSLYTHAAVALFLNNERLFSLLPSASLVAWLWPMLAALPAGYLCWLVLRGLGRWFGRKAFSDIQLVVDSWMFVAFFVMSPWTEGPTGKLVALLAFVVYRGVVAAALALWPPAAERTPRRLLVLRVFGFQKRTEDLYDEIVQRWRLRGSVNMIGGADLAGRTIDPGEIVTFVGGDLRTLFVRTGVDLKNRIEALDNGRDPDGRFRVNELYCHEDTWRPTLESLLARSDGVLMDLRGFTRTNSGVRFELEKIVQSGRLGQTLIVVDHTTDLPLLRASLGAEHEHALNLAPVETRSRAELGTLFGSLQRIATAEPAGPTGAIEPG